MNLIKINDNIIIMILTPQSVCINTKLHFKRLGMCAFYEKPFDECRI